MPRRIAIVAVLVLTVLMGAWLLTISAGAFRSGDGDIDSAPVAGVASEAGTSGGQPAGGEGDGDAYEDHDDDDDDHDDDDHDDDEDEDDD